MPAWTYLESTDPMEIVTESQLNPLLFLRVQTCDGNAVQINLHYRSAAALAFLDELCRHAALLRERIAARMPGESWLTAAPTPDLDHGGKPSRKSGTVPSPS